jgi:hypothetical protein
MGGVSLESMKTVLSTHKTLEETTKATGLFAGLATTNQTHRTGKWIFMTTTDQAAAANKFLDEDFKRAYDSLKDGDKTQFGAFPNPSRMTHNSVPMLYMNNIAKSASTASKSIPESYPNPQPTRGVQAHPVRLDRNNRNIQTQKHPQALPVPTVPSTTPTWNHDANLLKPKLKHLRKELKKRSLE